MLQGYDGFLKCWGLTRCEGNCVTGEVISKYSALHVLEGWELLGMHNQHPKIRKAPIHINFLQIDRLFYLYKWGQFPCCFSFILGRCLVSSTAQQKPFWALLGPPGSRSLPGNLRRLRAAWNLSSEGCWAPGGRASLPQGVCSCCQWSCGWVSRVHREEVEELSYLWSLSSQLP